MAGAHAIILALSALGTDYWGPASSPQAGPIGPPPFVADAPCVGTGCGTTCGGCGGGLVGDFCARCKVKTYYCLHCMNGMPQHFPYMVPFKNYYFFRPYNYTVLIDQQAEIAALGGNPLQPYDNRFFQRIYQEVEALPTASPVPVPFGTPPASVPVAPPPAPSEPLPALPPLPPAPAPPSAS